MRAAAGLLGRACCTVGRRCVPSRAARPLRPPAQKPDVTAELFVEVLGCLANLYLPEFDFLGLVRKHDLLSFLATYAQVRCRHSSSSRATARSGCLGGAQPR
jgi:hypothetical protein